MMKKGYLLPTAMMLSVLALNSCSIFKPSDSEKSDKGTQGWYESGNGSVGAAVETTDQNAKANGKNKMSKAGKAKARVDEKLKEIADAQVREVISGDWAIEQVLGKQAVGETAPFLKFVPSENRLYGNNGCNTMSGEYQSNPADNTLSFGNIATTMMLCAKSGITDVEIGQALGLTKKYAIDSSKPDNLLYFYDEAGNVVMQLMHRDFHFLDGTWTVEKINGEKVEVDGMKLALDVDEKRMHGNTGCNIINGELETDMDAANSISFSGIAMTRMSCPDSGWETRMMVALEEAVTAKIVSDDTVEFLGSNGRQVMLLRKTAPTDN